MVVVRHNNQTFCHSVFLLTDLSVQRQVRPRGD